MMIEPASLAVFFSAALLLAVVPGPDNLFVLAQSLIGGRVAGFMITLGLCTGLLVHIIAVSVGVAAVIKASDVAFTALKLAGAAYLVYLAWRAFQAAGVMLNKTGDSLLTLTQLYRRGIFMNVTNPKVTLFFLAFLPQFINPELGPVLPQIITLGAVFIIATLIVFGGVAALAGRVGAWLNKSVKSQVWLYRTAGILFVVLAVNLVVAQR